MLDLTYRQKDECRLPHRLSECVPGGAQGALVVIALLGHVSLLKSILILKTEIALQSILPKWELAFLHL